MTSTTDPIIADIQQQFEGLLSLVTAPASRSASADGMERALFRQLLALGAQLLQLFFVSRASVRPTEPVLSPDGTRLRCHDRRSRRYVSIFGTLRIVRQAFTAPAQPLVYPLDQELHLPGDCYSALLREWSAYGSTDAAYRETQTLLERILGLSLSVQALESELAKDAVDLAAFDGEPRPAGAETSVTATLLVVQADGKGVPLVLPGPATRPVRPTSGRPPGRMKEAIVTAHYAIAPWPRTPQDLVAALLDDSAAAHPARQGQAVRTTPRPRPVGKELRASMQSKTVAVRDLARRVAQRDQRGIRQQVALTDGAEALQDEVRRAFPEATLVLDIIHATEYLWQAANAVLGERHPQRIAWMRTQLTALLHGQTEAVIATLQAAADDPGRSEAQRDALEKTMRYYRRNRGYMHYGQYLAAGWPIGTGVVEGACGHLVKDRLQQAGMRWTPAGAQVVLDLRGVRLSGQWDDYWTFHRQQEDARLYGSQATTVIPLEVALFQRQVAA